MIKPSEVNTTNVTDEQIGRCHKAFSGSIAFYMVESEQDALTEYKVTWSKKHGFTCTCKAGQHGFAHCKAGICKHVVWSVAAAREEQEAVAELHRLIAVQAAPATYSNVDTATRARIEAANERQLSKPVSRAKANNPRAFSLLR